MKLGYWWCSGGHVRWPMWGGEGLLWRRKHGSVWDQRVGWTVIFRSKAHVRSMHECCNRCCSSSYADHMKAVAIYLFEKWYIERKKYKRCVLEGGEQRAEDWSYKTCFTKVKLQLMQPCHISLNEIPAADRVILASILAALISCKPEFPEYKRYIYGTNVWARTRSQHP